MKTSEALVATDESLKRLRRLWVALGAMLKAKTLDGIESIRDEVIKITESTADRRARLEREITNFILYRGAVEPEAIRSAFEPEYGTDDVTAVIRRLFERHVICETRKGGIRIEPEVVSPLRIRFAIEHEHAVYDAPNKRLIFPYQHDYPKTLVVARDDA